MTPQFTRKFSIHPVSHSLSPIRLLAAAAGVLLLFSAAAPLAIAQTPTMIVLRAMPQSVKRGDGYRAQPPLTKDDIGEIRLNRKPVPIVSVDPVLKGPHTLQIMVLLDSMQMIGGNGQFDSMRKFFNSMPPNVEIGVGWMLQSHVRVVQPFTTDRKLVSSDTVLRRQTQPEAASSKNDNGNPFSCLRDLAAHWPGGNDPAKLRAVLMFTDGIIRSNAQQQGGDQLNPDVDGASRIMQQYGVIPYPFFYMDFPTLQGRTEGAAFEGQEHFTQLVADTGGYALFEGQFSPSSFDPLLDRFYSDLQNAVVVTVNSPDKPTKQESLDITSKKEGVKIFGPDNVTIGNTLKK
jgi:hypothetical protein